MHDIKRVALDEVFAICWELRRKDFEKYFIKMVHMENNEVQ